MKKHASKLPAQLCAMLVGGALPCGAGSRDGAGVIGVYLYCANRRRYRRRSRQPSYIRGWYGMAVGASVPEE